MNVTELKDALDLLGPQMKHAQVRVVQGNMAFHLQPDNIYTDLFGMICIDIENNIGKWERQNTDMPCLKMTCK